MCFFILFFFLLLIFDLIHLISWKVGKWNKVRWDCVTEPDINGHWRLQSWDKTLQMCFMWTHRKSIAIYLWRRWVKSFPPLSFSFGNAGAFKRTQVFSVELIRPLFRLKSGGADLKPIWGQCENMSRLLKKRKKKKRLSWQHLEQQNEWCSVLFEMIKQTS